MPAPVLAIATCTFRRPEGLRRLLEGVAALEIPGSVEPLVVVVDNDAAGPARPVVEQASGLPGPVRYAVEPAQGIVNARNRAVAEARAAGADWLAFVDDDEVPSPDWLRELWAARERHRADVVVGPVFPEFDEPPPPWVERGRFFDPPRFPDGQRMDWAVTNNVLVSMALFGRLAGDGLGSPFSLRYNTSGGEDTQLFARAREFGSTIVWADRATVVEHVPATRTNVRWLVQRQYRRGLTLSLVLREQTRSRARVAKRLGKAGVAVLRAAGQALRLPVDGRPAGVRALQQLGFAGGLVAGLFGVNFDEYGGEIHGS